MKRIFLLIIAVALVVTALPATASAKPQLKINASASSGSLQRFMAIGIDGKNANHARSQVVALGGVNDSYAAAIARQAGRDVFVASEYKQHGYGPAPADTSNSGQASNGTVVNAGNTGAGVKSLKLFNIKTKKTVWVMVRCGNPRLGGKCHCKPKKVKKVNQIIIHKKFKKVVHTACPSGQAVTVIVTGVATGRVKGTVFAKVIGTAKIRITEQINLKVTEKVKVLCGPAPTPPPPAQVNKCPDLTDANGNCVNQSNASTETCGNGSGNQATCQTIQINNNCGNVDVGGTNNTQGDNCNTGCTSNCQPCSTCQPPAEKPVITGYTVLNDVYVNETSPNFCATVQLQGSDTGTLTFSPDYGKFPTQSGVITFTVHSGDQVCSTYTAPGEVPPGGTDTIHIFLHDDTNGLSADEKSTTFAVKQNPPNPG